MEKINKVAVLGMGMVSSLAADAGNPGGENNACGMAFSRIGQVDTGTYLPGISLRCIDRITIYTGVAASMALGNRIAEKAVDASEVGMALGTAMGSMVSISGFDLKALGEGPNAVNPMEFPNTVSNAPASKVGIWFKLKGPSVTVSNGLTSSMDAVGFAYNEIAYGEARYYLAGGSEELSDNVYKGYFREAARKCRQPVPDDATEVVGEGSGILFLSNMEAARAGGHTVEGEIIDFFSSKMIPNDDCVKNTVGILNSMIYENDMLKNKTLVYMSYIPYNELSRKVLAELEEHFGKERVVITNRSENSYMNYIGTNGVFNTAYALRDLKKRGGSAKSALVVDMADDGKVSCTAVKC